jgi:hypothetical protein
MTAALAVEPYAFPAVRLIGWFGFMVLSSENTKSHLGHRQQRSPVPNEQSHWSGRHYRVLSSLYLLPPIEYGRKDRECSTSAPNGLRACSSRLFSLGTPKIRCNANSDPVRESDSPSTALG